MKINNASSIEYMQQALRLAQKGLYTTDPNPRVGCVIVKDGKIVGEAWHKRAGEPHAEVLALQEAGENAKGATVYVTLEPCNHTGKTPPCVEALINAGVVKVFAAMEDPNTLVAGKGFEKLRENGIETECGLLEHQARLLNPGFIKRMTTGLPYVRLKMAMSLDGRTAMASGESKWITGEAARRDVQFYRARSSAVLTGIGTVLSDDPSMNVRLTGDELGIDGEVRQPQRIVLDSLVNFPDNAKICKQGDDVLLVSTIEAKKVIAGCEMIHVPAVNGRVDLDEIMNLLAVREINEVHIEAGSKLSGALLQKGLVDEIIVYIAPHLMGDEARGLFSFPGLSEMKNRLSLNINDIRMVGKDVRITATPVYV